MTQLSWLPEEEITDTKIQAIATEMRNAWAVEQSHRGIFQFAVEFMMERMKL